MMKSGKNLDQIQKNLASEMGCEPTVAKAPARSHAISKNSAGPAYRAPGETKRVPAMRRGKGVTGPKNF